MTVSFPGRFGKPRKPRWTCATAIVYYSYHLIQSACITGFVPNPVYFKLVARVNHFRRLPLLHIIVIIASRTPLPLHTGHFFSMQSPGRFTSRSYRTPSPSQYSQGCPLLSTWQIILPPGVIFSGCISIKRLSLIIPVVFFSHCYCYV